MFHMKISGKLALVVAGIGGFLLLGGVPQLHAYTRQQCNKYVYRAQKNVGKQIRQHGEGSWQVREARRQLEQTRANCGEYGYGNRGYGRGRGYYGNRDWNRDRRHDRDRNWDRDRHRDRGRDRDRDRKDRRDHDHDNDHDHR